MELFEQALKRFELIELVIPAGSTGTRFPYPDIPQLRDDTTQDIIICGLESYSVEALPLAPSGNTTMSFAQMQNTFLTLYVEGEESVRQVPFIRLNAMREAAAAGTTFNVVERLPVEYLKVDWNKTYNQAAAPYGTVGAPNTQFSILLGVWYKKLPPGSWKVMTANRVQGW
jgi:hypothetical protein